jgi:hypothetical protein
MHYGLYKSPRKAFSLCHYFMAKVGITIIKKRLHFFSSFAPLALQHFQNSKDETLRKIRMSDHNMLKRYRSGNSIQYTFIFSIIHRDLPGMFRSCYMSWIVYIGALLIFSITRIAISASIWWMKFTKVEVVVFLRSLLSVVTRRVIVIRRLWFLLSYFFS